MGVSVSDESRGQRLEDALQHGGLVSTPIPPLYSLKHSHSVNLSIPRRVLVKHRALIFLLGVSILLTLRGFS